MAEQTSFPIAPEMSVALGNELFLTCSKFKGVTRVHVRQYEENPITFTPTSNGVFFSMTDWYQMVPKFERWMQSLTGPRPAEILYTTPKFGVSYFTVDNEKVLSIVMLNRKSVDLTVQQFKIIRDSTKEIEVWDHELNQCAQLQE